MSRSKTKVKLPGPSHPSTACKPSSTESSSLVRLERKIGLLEGTAITVGAIIGSGIFISPKGIVESAGSVGLSLVIWVASGLVSLIGAICYTELGTSLPSSGGDYHYLFEAFGPILAFLYLWASIMIFIPCNNAILALSFAQYAIQPFFTTDCQMPDPALRLLAAAAICFLIALNCFDVSVAAKMQNIFSFAKLTILAIIIIAGFVQIFRGSTENFSSLFEGSKNDPGSLALAFYSGIYAYGGANTLNCMTEEVKNPNRILPRAIYISIFTVIVAYLMANVAYFSVMTPQDVLDSEAVAVTFGDRTLGVATWIVPIFVAISTFGGLGINIMPYSRVLFVGARNGHFPDMFAHVQINRLTPMPALIFMGIMSLIYLSTSNIYGLINYAGFMYSVVAVGVVSAMLYLRWKRPELPRPIKVNLIYPVLYFFISVFLFVLPLYVATLEAVVGFGILMSGLPVYFILIKCQRRLPWLETPLDRITPFMQKLLLSVPEQ